MKKIKVFAPASIANLGCGFDIMGMALDEVGDILEMSLDEQGEGITITNETDVPLPEDIEDNVITPVLRKFFAMTGHGGRVDVRVVKKIYPGSGIGSSAASSAACTAGHSPSGMASCLPPSKMSGKRRIAARYSALGIAMPTLPPMS